MPATRKTTRTILWEPSERSGLIRTGGSDQPIEKLVSAPLDPKAPKNGHFDLYYFVYPPRVGHGNNTVLFCSGGPGQIVRPASLETTYADFLVDNGYNVVHFHLRGCGFSQIPPSVRFDKFLRTRFAVEDIEAIRRDFLGKNGTWDAIIGRSYGTILAQQYAHFHTERVRKLILIAPLSRHMFKTSGAASDAEAAFDDFSDEVREILRETLKNIFNSPEQKLQDEFGDLGKFEERKIIETVFGNPDEAAQNGLFAKAEDTFGSIQFIVDAYDDLQKRGLLKKYELEKFTRNFFRRLRDLRLVGSMIDKGGLVARQIEIGRTIREEVGKEKQEAVKNEEVDRESLSQREQHMQDSHRVSYAMGVFDGINPRFLRARLRASNKKDNREALKEMGGDTQVKEQEPVNKWLDKLRIDNKAKIKPWDPAKYSHGAPTLILKGSADPVTAAGQAEHIFHSALTGPRILIEFPAVGHDISLPDGEPDQCVPILSGVIHVPPCEIVPGETKEVRGAISGRSLNKDLHIVLRPPPNLQSGLKVRGYGVLTRGMIRDSEPRTAENNIWLLIENTSSRRSEKVDSHWSISSAFFLGTVWFELPSIPGGTAKLVIGKIIHGIKNPANELRPMPDPGLEPGLELFGYKFNPPDNLELWLANKGDKKVDGKARRWSLMIGSRVIGRFKFNSPLIQPGKIASSDSVTVDGLRSNAGAELMLDAVNSNGELKGCVPPQVVGKDFGHRISVRIVNTGPERIPAQSETWRVDNAAFSATLDVEHDQILPGGGVEGLGEIKDVTWKEWLTIKEPSDREPDIELLGFNILGPNEISLLFSNNGKSEVKTLARDWVYIDPSDKDPSDELPKSACLNCGNVLNCLIYSFLIMDTSRFNNEEDNTILRVVQEIFQRQSLTFTKQFAEGNRRGNEASSLRD
jgi:pimeloyl-ACP methyl ester carboxylesterase